MSASLRSIWGLFKVDAPCRAAPIAAKHDKALDGVHGTASAVPDFVVYIPWTTVSPAASCMSTAPRN